MGGKRTHGPLEMEEKMITKPKLLLHLSVLLISIIFSLFSTYLYFELFGHDRYFSTLSKVVAVERKMIRGIAQIEGIDLMAEKNIKSFKDVFDPLKCFVPITITSGNESGKIVYTNMPTETERVELKRCLRYLYDFDNPNWGEPSKNNVEVGEYVVRIGEYNTPIWSKRFLRWIVNPAEWFASYRNRITTLFFMFTCLFYSASLAFIWANRSKHLSEDIKPLLEKLNKQRDQK